MALVVDDAMPQLARRAYELLVREATNRFGLALIGIMAILLYYYS